MRIWLIKYLGGYTVDEYLDSWKEYRNLLDRTLKVLELREKPSNVTEMPLPEPVNRRNTPWTIRQKELERSSYAVKSDAKADGDKIDAYWKARGGTAI